MTTKTEMKCKKRHIKNILKQDKITGRKMSPRSRTTKETYKKRKIKECKTGQ